jgi:plastocyanin
VIKRFLPITGLMLSVFSMLQAQAQVLHQVSVVDHAFQPRTLRISEGDTVRWEWKGDLHNVVAVTLPGGGVKSGAFESELLNTNASFEVEFSRELLNQYSRDSGVFDYVCEPHAFFGMHGSVSVTRTAKTFVGTASAWQAGGTGSEELNIVADLSGNERTLTLSVPGAENTLPFELRLGGIGEPGATVCSGSIAPGGDADCTIEESNHLFQGNMFVLLNSRLRAQLVRQGLRGAISGRIRGSDGQVVSGVTVSIGGISSQSDAMGNYRLANLPFGVYQLAALYPGVGFRETGWSNPTLLITTELYQRDFETSVDVPGSLPLPSPTVGDVCIGIREQLSLLTSSIHSSFDLGIEYLSDKSLVEVLRTQKLRVVVKVLRGATFEDADLDGILTVSMAQGKGSGEFALVNEAGESICSEQFTAVINSPLNKRNLYKVKQMLVQATVKAKGGGDKVLLEETSALLMEMASGGAENPRYPKTLNRRLVVRLNAELNRIRRSSAKSQRRLSRLVERVTQSIELLEEMDRLKAGGHESH